MYDIANDFDAISANSTKPKKQRTMSRASALLDSQKIDNSEREEHDNIGALNE
jgi:hypothetical protein